MTLRADERVLVVGIDGSPNSEAALVWAVDDVTHQGGRIRAVVAWHRRNDASSAADQEELAAHALRRVVDAVPHAAVDITEEVIEGIASDVLVERAEGATLLVVGTLGLRAGRRVLLGSVSSRCALRATCPVVVVPERWTPRPLVSGLVTSSRRPS